MKKIKAKQPTSATSNPGSGPDLAPAFPFPPLDFDPDLDPDPDPDLDPDLDPDPDPASGPASASTPAPRSVDVTCPTGPKSIAVTGVATTDVTVPAIVVVLSLPPPVTPATATAPSFGGTGAGAPGEGAAECSFPLCFPRCVEGVGRGVVEPG